MQDNTTSPPESSQASHRSSSAETTDNSYLDRLIPLELIDPPSLPERETMDEVYLADLALDIIAIGLTNPITVFQKGDRYEVIAGHRRYLACGLAGLVEVPCRVRVGKDVDPLAIMVSENAEREPVNPVEQARFYQRVLVTRGNNDVDQLCAIVKRRREHVEGRLILLMGHPEIVAAVEAKKISLAVAAELNKIPDEGRLLLLLDVAIRSGATAKLVSEWRVQGAELGPIQILAESDLGPATPAYTPMASNPMKCVLCEGEEYAHLMEMLWVHGPCKTMLFRLLQRLPMPGQETEA